MNIQLTTFIFLYCFHYIADFICQTKWQQENKSCNNLALDSHIAVYSIIMGLLTTTISVYIRPFEGLNIPMFLWAFALFTILWATPHHIVDYITSRISKKYFEKKDYHMGFVIVGFDQLLHVLHIVGITLLISPKNIV